MSAPLPPAMAGLAERLRAALGERLAADSELGPELGLCQSRRLFHGRGQCYPGLEDLSVDWYAPVAFAVAYSARVEPLLLVLADTLADLLGYRLACLLVQRRYLPEAPSEVLWGELPAAVEAVEGDLRYRLRLGAAQNIGFFPDMAEGRALVRRLAPGRRVLNLFAYTCSFSVAALAGGAAQVVNVDMNRGALQLGRENHRLNRLELRRATFLAHDVFKSLAKLRRLGPFDLVVLDPPSDQGRSFEARRDWPKLVRRLPEWLEPGAAVVACLNSPRLPAAFLTELFAAHCPAARLRGRCHPAAGFPEQDPESGLKVLHYQM